MAKRKPRNKMAKKVNVLFPISLEEFGTENDPCFGKLNDPRASECQSCGDCEVCAIVQSQNTHLKRAKVEAKKKFKDLEEVNILKNQDRKEVRKKIKNTVRKWLKGGRPMEIDNLISSVHSAIPESKKLYPSKKLKSLLIKLPEKSEHITYNESKNILLWK